MPSLLPYATGYTEQPWHGVGKGFLKVAYWEAGIRGGLLGGGTFQDVP